MSEVQKAPDPLLDRFAEIVGAERVITDPDVLAPRLIDWRRKYTGATRCMVEPADTDEVAALVRTCAEARVPIVPQGGHTSLVGGSTPYDTGDAVILSTRRLNRIREIDPRNDTMTVEAGCILADLQSAAAAADRLFPLSLGAEGTCQIGGNLSTNAGGINVLRYGNARDQVLGLEVVLADGRVWNGLRRLRKDNTGYDLKHLFIGAEGTLGIITAAVLKLHPRPRETETAFVAVRDVDAALAVFGRVQAATARSCVSCELMPRVGIDLALKHIAGTTDPIADRHDWYLLIEVAGGSGGGALREALETALAEAYEAGEVPDAALAESDGQRQAFWQVREAIVEGQRQEGGSIKHDIAVPVSQVPAFLDRAIPAVEALIPGLRPVPFGHLGDGNLHFNLSQPEDMDAALFLQQWERVNAVVHDIVMSFDGSISAEHGLGRMKVDENRRFKPGVEIEMMQGVKRMLDPRNIMNPGKVVRP
jgi:D-lactate dehydrogenase (cytochrome)